MNLLLELYGLSYPMILVSDSRQRYQALESLEAEMFVTAAMTLLCTAAIVFYARFLVALCKEGQPRLFGHRLRLRLDFGEDTIAELTEQKDMGARAA